jgi:hypothetical protein
LKNFDGAIRQQVTLFLRKVKYRYLFTATPSPNDFIELGTSSEALGQLGYTDMLTKFFTNNIFCFVLQARRKEEKKKRELGVT